MEEVNFHDLRHSCASIMLGLGVDLHTISKVLCHSNVQTTCPLAGWRAAQCTGKNRRAEEV